MRNVIFPYFGEIAIESDINIRNKCVEFLLEFCFESKTSRLELILDIFEKVKKKICLIIDNIKITRMFLIYMRCF